MEDELEYVRVGEEGQIRRPIAYTPDNHIENALMGYHRDAWKFRREREKRREAQNIYLSSQMDVDNHIRLPTIETPRDVYALLTLPLINRALGFLELGLWPLTQFEDGHAEILERATVSGWDGIIPTTLPTKLLADYEREAGMKLKAAYLLADFLEVMARVRYHGRMHGATPGVVRVPLVDYMSNIAVESWEQVR